MPQGVTGRSRPTTYGPGVASRAYVAHQTRLTPDGAPLPPSARLAPEGYQRVGSQAGLGVGARQYHLSASLAPKLIENCDVLHATPELYRLEVLWVASRANGSELSDGLVQVVDRHLEVACGRWCEAAP